MNEKEAVDHDSLTCIICCERKNDVLLLPCRHLHTCEACWSLWCIQCIDKNSDISFDIDDENCLKPTCPYCKLHVDSILKVII